MQQFFGFVLSNAWVQKDGVTVFLIGPDHSLNQSVGAVEFTIEVIFPDGDVQVICRIVTADVIITFGR
jgi:hypothetical protein